jgi:hypothetical protein
MQQIVVAYEARMKLINDVLLAIFPPKSNRTSLGGKTPEQLFDVSDAEGVNQLMQGFMASAARGERRRAHRAPDGSIITTGGAPDP